MSLRSKHNSENIPNDDNDEDSLVELGEFAIISASKASLRYRSVNELNQSFNFSRKNDPASNKLLKAEVDLPVSSNEQKTLFSSIKESIFLPYRGYFFGLFSAFSFCLSQVLLRRSKWLSGSDHSTIRYTTTFIVMIIYMKYHEMGLTGPKKQFNLILIRGLLGSFALISIYFAIMFINPSDVVSLAHSSIVITAIMSRIFLKEKLTLAHIFSIFLTATGVLFISKPSFLFQIENENLNQSFKNETEIVELDTAKNYKLPIGIGMTFLGSIFTSVVYLVLKKLSNSKVHWSYSTICVSWFGLPLSIALSMILVQLGYYHQDLEAEKSDLPMDIFYSFIASCLSLSGQILLNISFKYEDATKIAITKTIDVFFSFFLQFLVLSIPIDTLSIFGAICILVGTFFVLLFRLIESKYEEYKIRKQQQDFIANDQIDKPKKKSIKSVLVKLIFFKF
ncbi:unnamed protein product [Brachionus calyciflorus]|uniref:EamA domain-containing protein n=1 Tax=Brachionus calyciflorus TaxID=104777 RepID=A0A814DRZ1_9BILA|nr:unnamed protein product [Brachionus calyciflorus]